MDLAYDDVRYTVYTWGFLIWIISLTYLSHEAVNWVCNASFAIFAFIEFYFGFLILLLLLYFISLHPGLPLVFYSTSLLLLSYYTMHILYLISLTISLPAPVCLCSWYGFQYKLFWFRFIDTLVLIPAHHLTFTTPLVGEFLTPLNLHVQISELGACGFSWLLIRDAQLKRGSSADRLRPYPSRPSARLSSFLFVTRERLLYCSLVISLYILAFAPYRWCNILIILCHMLW